MTTINTGLRAKCKFSQISDEINYANLVVKPEASTTAYIKII
jgi:hypothetical protein